MKKYSVEDFNNFEVDEDGYKICPSGDYTEIKTFEEKCRFGEWSSFGEWSRFGKNCSFGKTCSFGEESRFGEASRFGEECSFGRKCIIERKYVLLHMRKIEGIGSRRGCTYFFECEEGLFVRCGCFFGSIAEFEDKVKGTYDEDDKHYKEYIGAVKYIKSILN